MPIDDDVLHAASAPEGVLKATLSAIGDDLTIEAKEADGDGLPKLATFSLTAYNGGLMELGRKHPVVVDLETQAVTEKSRPVLRDHDPGRIVGHTSGLNGGNGVENDGRVLRVAGVVSAANADADEIVRAARNRFPWQVSGGWKLTRPFEQIAAGRTAVVNGKTVKGPALIARHAVLNEVSFVALGADDSTAAEVAASFTPDAESDEMKLNEWLKAKGFDDPSALTDTQRDALKAAFEAEQTVADSDKSKSGDLNASGALDDYAANLRKINAEESVRVAKINAIAARHPSVVVKADGGELPLAAHAIAEGWDADRTELHALRHSRPAAVGPRRGAEDGDPNLRAMVAQASLMASSGLSEAEIAASFPADKREQVMNAAAEPENRGTTLHVLMDSVIAAAGRHYSGKRGSDAHIRAAVEADRELKATGFSTMSLATTLGSAANKVMITRYRAASAAWRAIARVRSHVDFKPVSAVRVDASGAFREIAADGELKHVKLEESAYTNKLGTYGAISTWTRQDVINDDLGARMAIYEEFGDMAASRIDEAVFKTLLANPGSFFSVGNGNLLSGADSALSIAALESAETLYSNQVNTAGRPINHSPAKLLTGTALQVTARNLYRETSIAARPAEGTTQFVNNPHAGKYEPVVSPWLNNTAVRDQNGEAVTGQSATQWYLFADPNVRAAMAVAFLNGRQEPFIEAVDMPADVLGFGTRAYADFGVGMEDPSAAVRSVGA